MIFSELFYSPIVKYEELLKKTMKELKKEEKKELDVFKEEINQVKKWVKNSKENEIRQIWKGSLHNFRLLTILDHKGRIIRLESHMGESKNLLQLMQKQRQSIELISKETQISYKDICFKLESVSKALF